MFGRTRGTIIGQGLKVVGKVTAEGLVEVYGEIDGEVQCASLFLARKARVDGAITAAKVIVDGRVEGPIDAADVVLKSRAHVVGDIRHRSLAIRKGAYFEGRSLQAHSENGRQPDKAGKKQFRLAARTDFVATADHAR